MISFETRAQVYYRFQSGQGEVEEVNRLSPYPVSEEFICVFLQDWEYNIDKVNKVNRVTIWILMIVSLRGDYMDGVVFLLTWQRYSRRGLILYPKKIPGMVFQFSINHLMVVLILMSFIFLVFVFIKTTSTHNRPIINWKKILMAANNARPLSKINSLCSESSKTRYVKSFKILLKIQSTHLREVQ